MTDTKESPPTKCVSEEETRTAYERLVSSKKCGKGNPCFREVCRYCLPVLVLIDKRALECDARGCSPLRCIYDEV